MALEEAEVRRIWNQYYEDLYNTDTQEQVVVHICGFDEARRCSHLIGEPVRVGKLKNEVTGEMIKGGFDRVVDWIWALCNIAFEIGVALED